MGGKEVEEGSGRLGTRSRTGYKGYGDEEERNCASGETITPDETYFGYESRKVQRHVEMTMPPKTRLSHSQIGRQGICVPARQQSLSGGRGKGGREETSESNEAQLHMNFIETSVQLHHLS